MFCEQRGERERERKGRAGEGEVNQLAGSEKTLSAYRFGLDHSRPLKENLYYYKTKEH